MLTGPIFAREALTQPRQLSHFLIRSGYVAALFVLMYTASQATFGWQQARNLSDLARFGSLVFQVFSIVQLSLVLFFALLFAAGRVAQEKDRRTMLLLLMTDMRDRELVLGKLMSSLLVVAVLLGVSVPVFLFIYLLGGVTLAQIGWSVAICAVAAYAAGSWGTLVAFARDKTFQTMAVSVLGLVVFLALIEVGIAVVGSDSSAGWWLALWNPFRAIIDVLNPWAKLTGVGVAHVSAAAPVAALFGLAVVLNTIAIRGLRWWNPPRSIHHQVELDDEEDAVTERKGKVRQVWQNPIIWREICTRAYGGKVFLIKLDYLVMARFAVAGVIEYRQPDDLVTGMISLPGFAFVGLAILSILIINAQAVTALTSERDGQTLELLLVTDISAKEFIFGKLGGVTYNMKELILIPWLLLASYAWQGTLSFENFLYATAGFLTLVWFAEMLGLHAGLSFDSSRIAIAIILGPMLFLMISIFFFMILMVEARGSFFLQFQSFLVFIGAGSIGLYASWTSKNPSVALSLAAALLPFMTFYAITEFLLGGSLGVCLSIMAAYGFAITSMLIPAVSEFDVALGRTTLDKG